MITHPELKARPELQDSFAMIYEWEKYSKEFGVPVFVSEYDEKGKIIPAGMYMVFFRGKKWWGSVKVSKELINDEKAIDSVIKYYCKKLKAKYQ
jgi:Zn-dependent peptidase ImmA (M78 family)